MVGKLINIASWLIKSYDNVKAFIKKYYRIYRSRKIRNAVDDGDVDYVRNIVRRIKKKRRRRYDAS